MCKLFCSSLLREPSDDVIRVCIYVCLSLSVNLHLHLQLIYLAVSMVLSPQVVRDEKHKVDEALRYSKAKLAYTRTDERRKVLLCNHMKHSTSYNIVFQCLGKHPYPTVGINLCQPRNYSCKHHQQHGWCE